MARQPREGQDREPEQGSASRDVAGDGDIGPRTGRRYGRKLAGALVLLGAGWLAGFNSQTMDVAENAAWLRERGGDLSSVLALIQKDLASGFEQPTRIDVPTEDVKWRSKPRDTRLLRRSHRRRRALSRQRDRV